MYTSDPLSAVAYCMFMTCNQVQNQNQNQKKQFFLCFPDLWIVSRPFIFILLPLSEVSTLSLWISVWEVCWYVKVIFILDWNYLVLCILDSSSVFFTVLFLSFVISSHFKKRYSKTKLLTHKIKTFWMIF